MLGVKNAGRVLLMEDENDRVEIKFEKLNLDVKDLMTTKPFEFFRDVTVASHGVPPRMLGIVTAGQLGGVLCEGGDGGGLPAGRSEGHSG